MWLWEREREYLSKRVLKSMTRGSWTLQHEALMVWGKHHQGEDWWGQFSLPSHPVAKLASPLPLHLWPTSNGTRWNQRTDTQTKAGVVVRGAKKVKRIWFRVLNVKLLRLTTLPQVKIKKKKKRKAFKNWGHPGFHFSLSLGLMFRSQN